MMNGLVFRVGKRKYLMLVMTIISVCLLSQNLDQNPMVINGVSVPIDFPIFTPTINDATAPGYIFLDTEEGPPYILIFENDGTPIFYRRLKQRVVGFKPYSSGLLTMRAWEGIDGFVVLDSNYRRIDTLHVQNGYDTDMHELQLLPNGNALMIASEHVNMDLSSLVPNGKPEVEVRGTHIQEVNENDSVVFEWLCWNHYDILDTYEQVEGVSNLNYVHMNSIAMDYDGHLVVSSRHLSECTKINRQTGEVIWRLGGKNNQFNFINDLDQNSYQHDFRPVPGKPDHYTLMDNGNMKNPQYSRAVEFKLDIENMTAEKVWEYRHSPDWYTRWRGNVQRLPNGNTFVNWADNPLPKAFEVTPDGEVVYEAGFENSIFTYRVFRSEWNGFMLNPYLIAEPFADKVRLIFNKFGDEGVDYFNIYGGKDQDQMIWIDSTSNAWIDLVDLEDYSYCYLNVTAVDTSGIESPPSETERVFVRNSSPGENLIVNGDFSDGFDYWAFMDDGEAYSHGIFTDSTFRFQIDSAGTKSSDIQLRQQDIPLVNGAGYVLEFEAWADSPRLIEIKIIRNIGPWTNYSQTSDVYLTEEPKLYSYLFTMEEVSDPLSRLVIYGGTSDVDFEIKDISLRQVIETGIALPEKVEEIKVFPNPSGDFVNVSFYLEMESEIVVQLFSLTGQLIETVNYGKSYQGEQQFHLNTEGLANGSYMLCLRDGRNSHSTIMIVQH